MKILHVVNDASTGGAQTLIEQLARQLGTSVESHILVLLGPGPLSPRFERCASSVTYLNVNKRSLRIDTLVRKTRRIIRRLSPDVVHSHLLQADLAVAFAVVGLNTAAVSTVHTTGMTAQDPLRSRFLGRILGIISNRFIMRSVACGVGAAEYMQRRGYDSNKTSVIHNGVVVSKVTHEINRSKLDSILCLSRWHPMKDHSTLLRGFQLALNDNPDLRLVCAGTGMSDENEELVTILDSLHVRDFVTLMGPVEDVRALLQRSDSLVISSLYGEALPMAGLEALAEGVPVITTDVGDCRRLTVDRWQCVAPGDPYALAEALQILSRLSQEEYISVARRSFGRVQEDYSIAFAASKYLTLYKEVCGTLRKNR